MKTSSLWNQLVKNQFSKINSDFLINFRESGQANNRLAAWDPFDKTMRYFKFLLFNQLQQKNSLFFDRYKNIGETTVGNPVTLSIHKGTEINLDHFFSIEEYTFLNKSIELSKISEIVEIGAGFGRTAQALIKLSKKIKKYTIIDIPEVLSLSSIYLEKVLNRDEYKKVRFINALTLSGESNDFSSCDLVINIDSFQEMPKETIKYYYENVINKATYFYTKNAVGKYQPDLVGIYDINPEELQDVFSLGLSTEIVDIFNVSELEIARKKHVAQYRPSKQHVVISQEPLGIFPYYHNVLYGLNNTL